MFCVIVGGVQERFLAGGVVAPAGDKCCDWLQQLPHEYSC